LAAWTEAAAGKLREKWGDEDDEDAIKDPMHEAVQKRLKEERDTIRAEVGSLESFREKCVARALQSSGNSAHLFALLVFEYGVRVVPEKDVFQGCILSAFWTPQIRKSPPTLSLWSQFQSFSFPQSPPETSNVGQTFSLTYASYASLMIAKDA
jgi:hypothetical protein